MEPVSVRHAGSLQRATVLTKIRIDRRRLTVALLAAAAGLGVASRARAEWQPTGPIRVIVPYAPGGGADLIARQLAGPMSEVLGRSLIVDNRGGGGGVIGMTALIHSRSDGYTIGLIAVGAHASNATLMPDLPYDSANGFTPITMIGRSPEVLVVSPSNPATSVQDMIDRAAKAKRTLSFASGGIGLGSHIAGELLKYRTGVPMTHLPYKGGGPAMVDVMGGQADMLFDPAGAVLSLVRGGKLKALAITGKERSKQLPDVPTMDQQGFPDFYVSESYALLGPPGMPDDAVARIRSAALDALKRPKLVEQFTAQAIEISPSTPAELHREIADEIKSYGAIIRNAGVKLSQ